VKGANQLVQIVDQAMAEAVRKSGSWLACRIGCYECCLGPFPITQLDALRLRAGLAELQADDPERAARVLRRARTLDETDEDEPCPALDPETGACDLYAARPITCRMFGPAVREPGGQSLAVCELCFRGATDEEIAAGAVEIDPTLESDLLQELERTTGARGDTTVALALCEDVT
jgi:Fe-S-cluster containining protein